MKETKKFSITISRQQGSGGAYIGQQLARKLDMLYVDREIIDEVARQYAVLADDLVGNDEKILSSWQSFLQFNTIDSNVYIPPRLMLPTDMELFHAEAGVIKQIVSDRPAVIIGRCASYILREDPHNVKIFLHADEASRIYRTQNLYHVSAEEAQRMITQTDKDRTRYCRIVTSREWEWSDARNYDLTIDTSRLEIDRCVELILNYLELMHVHS